MICFTTSIWFQLNIQLLIATTTDYVLMQFDSFILILLLTVDWPPLFKSAPQMAFSISSFKSYYFCCFFRMFICDLQVLFIANQASYYASRPG